jgi:single-stranded-DNA-specific exonuclease
MQWIPKPSDQATVEALVASLRGETAFRGTAIPTSADVLAPLLISRGINDADSAQCFLAPSPAHLHAPEQMTGLTAAVRRIEEAIERKETILIYGDYDVDGTMAVIILKTAIELCGGTT